MLVFEAAKVDVVRSVAGIVIATAKMAQIDIVLAVTFIATSCEIHQLYEVGFNHIIAKFTALL